MSNFDVAQLAHVELYSPKPEETLKFLQIILACKLVQEKGSLFI